MARADGTSTFLSQFTLCLHNMNLKLESMINMSWWVCRLKTKTGELSLLTIMIDLHIAVLRQIGTKMAQLLAFKYTNNTRRLLVGSTTQAWNTSKSLWMKRETPNHLKTHLARNGQSTWIIPIYTPREDHMFITLTTVMSFQSPRSLKKGCIKVMSSSIFIRMTDTKMS